MKKQRLIIGMSLLAVMILGPVAPSNARVALTQAGISSSATGTVLHADALRNAGSRLVDVEVAFSGAAYDSSGLDSLLRNEFERPFAPIQTGKTTQALGVGLEVGLGVTPDTENQTILAGRSVSVAPPTTPAITNVIGPLDADPLAWAALLKGTAMADSRSDGTCTLGGDLGRGLGYAADVQLLDAAADPARDGLEGPVVALDADGEKSAVSQSASRTLLVSQRGPDGRVMGQNFGLLSQVREGIAPVTFFEGTPNQFTIEFLAEWVLQAVATGVPGGAYIHYGPEVKSPDTPIVRILDASGHETRILTLQDLLTDEGLVISVPGLVELAIGENPRAIGGDADSVPAISANGTAVSAAVDVVRVIALPGAAMSLADLRIGHMEVRSNVPTGGVACPVQVTKKVAPSSVAVGKTFTTVITISNPYDCTLTDVRLTDAITTRGAALFTLKSTDPEASTSPTGTALSSGTAVWNDLGTIGAGKSRSVTLTMGARGGEGEILDTASAAATLGSCAGEGATVSGVGVGASGGTVQGASARASEDVSLTAVEAATATKLPMTGASMMMTLAIGLALAALAIVGLRLSRRRQLS